LPDAVPQPIETIVDAGSFETLGGIPTAVDPLGYPGYAEARAAARERSGSAEAVVTGAASIGGVPVEVAAFDFSFLGGSMGTAAGEQLALALERAAVRRVPFVLRTATGGARMQEGMASLAQMPKVVAARLALADAALPFVAVLGGPTTGGVLAALAALADVTIAEVGATVGFAGPRVVRAATGAAPSERSHTAESALDNGLVDAVVGPGELRAELARLLAILAAPARPSEAVPPPLPPPQPHDPWESLQSIRSPEWPRAPRLAREATGSFFELRGDRAGSEDPSCVAGIGTLGGARVLVLALDHERRPGPAAYRKAARCVHLAGRLGIPVVTLVDTPGADPSEESEAGGIAWAIAALFEAMLSVPVPVVAVLTGEGGSGGALAFAAGDVLLAYEGAVFAVIAPELAAEILWRDADRAADAARLLKMGAAALLDLGICDAVLPGGPGPESLTSAVAYHLGRLGGGSAPHVTRRQRWRNRLG
jgi:acetyl-CoA carboxylase carboxyl transferase beta subunit